VTPRRVGPLLRSLAKARQAAADADLLGRVAAGQDDTAFAALVERHGRLVWAVCRHLAGSDADDAFQATFLVLLRNAGRIRHPESLPAWLHGVAFRVAAKARQAARRRARRERTAAVPDRHAGAVPDSAWDRALAAVHEEVARLPEALRVPFVLCALEGRTVTEAAGHLGWKVTTLSARLGRAKDALLTRLQARGLTAGAVVALAIVAEPVPAAAARAAAVVGGDGTVVGRIQFLTHGVVGMSAHQVKLLAAGVLVALGLGVGGGAGWLTPAGAQSPPGAQPPALDRPASLTPEEKVRQLEAQLDRAKRELEDQKRADRRKAADEVARLATDRWQYAFVKVRDLDAEGFGKLLREREAGGWDYTGPATLKDAGAVWLFRRPVGRQLGLPTGDVGPVPPAANGLNPRFQPGASSASPLPVIPGGEGSKPGKDDVGPGAPPLGERK
jgi:RNA polymerase sigma factor (sigma-70 family)